ncbi:MAG: hypothetical protein ABIK07_04165 [Planctomycetota bacterium]|jgi:hypothetical protein|uniref:hypothetical protein n=1 Tax=uncultured Gimesia sp. TaxID=1678688 RepID=UPI00262C58D9|nr:hypothetical protein [uncultured Gimesia sp.]
MSLFDHYIPDPPLRCPVCDSVLEDWQGKDGPCFLLTWRQGIKFPVAHEWPDESVSDTKSFLESWTLPSRFVIYTDGCRCDRQIEAYGTCENGVWMFAEVVTHFNYRPGSLTSAQDEQQIRDDLKRWIENESR